MSLVDRFHILKTASSEVNKRTLFKNRCTNYIPDLFFAFCFASSLFAVLVFDKVFSALMFQTVPVIGVVIYAGFGLLSFIFLFPCKKPDDFIPGYKMPTWCTVILILLGFEPFLTCGAALKNCFENKNEINIPLKCYSHPIFHIQNSEMSHMKMNYIVNVALKCIPQLYIVSILIMERYITGELAIMGQLSLLLNMALFSMAMAMTFPLRSTPRVYNTSFCVLFNAFCKFMATFCGCGINLTIFTMLFSKTGYYALLINAIRSLLWVWPSWWVLRTQPYILKKFYFALCLFFLTLIFSFIYIHPFERKGKLIYYFFYLMKFLIEIFCIYVFTDARNESVGIYFSLKSVMMGYLSCYGLVNILHKYKLDKYGCEVDLEIQQPEKDEENVDDAQKINTMKEKKEKEKEKEEKEKKKQEEEEEKEEEKKEKEEKEKEKEEKEKKEEKNEEKEGEEKEEKQQKKKKKKKKKEEEEEEKEEDNSTISLQKPKTEDSSSTQHQESGMLDNGKKS